jgi:hypothetical protein
MTTATRQEPLFREVQGFPQWLLVIPVGVLVFILSVVFLEEPNVLDVLVPTIILSVVSVLFALARLETEVREDGLYIRFFPFHWTFQRFAFPEFASARVRQYSALGEYGGWGVRYNFFGNGRAYNVSGSEGVQLVFKDGQKLLIGSQRAEELSSAINS